MMIKMERGKRAKNFTPNEKMRFVELITRSKVLLSKSTDKYNGNSITIKDRERAWEKLAKDFNRGNETKRSLMALKKVWDNLRRDARMQSAKTRCEIYKTGGSSDIIENPLLLKVEAALGLSSLEQGNSYDSSTPQNVTNDDDISDPMSGEKYYADNNSWCDNSWKLHETSSFHEVSPSSRDLHPESNVMEEMSMPPPPPLQAAAAFQGRRHFKRRLRMEKTKKESLFNDLQAVAVSKNVSEKIKNDILLENLEKVKEDRLFVEAQRERQTSFERAQREIQLDILKLERKTKEAILKKIQSGCRCYCATCRCSIIPPPSDDKSAS